MTAGPQRPLYGPGLVRKLMPHELQTSSSTSFDSGHDQIVAQLRFKTELIKPRGLWRTAEQVEPATLEYVDWFNHRRLYEACGATSLASASRTASTRRPSRRCWIGSEQISPHFHSASRVRLHRCDPPLPQIQRKLPRIAIVPSVSRRTAVVRCYRQDQPTVQARAGKRAIVAEGCPRGGEAYSGTETSR